MFKILRYNTRRQRLIYDTGHNGINFIPTVILDWSGYGVEVERLFWNFLENRFDKVFSYKLKLCKDCHRML